MTDAEIIKQWQSNHGVGEFPDEPGYAEYAAALARTVLGSAQLHVK